MNKKKLAVLSLVLVLVVILCAACAKKEEKIGSATIKITFENKSNDVIELITIKDKIDEKNASMLLSNLGSDQTTEAVISAGLKNGAPDIDITIQTKNGPTFMQHITQNGSATITITSDSAGNFGSTVTMK